ncbi:MAG: hypothetical protein Q8R30_01270 [bacterium]|nr:hypothetical protein [bacterium]MDZ4285670.1 hypothetical protein [Candidatus Sungbacteria bacterium]
MYIDILLACALGVSAYFFWRRVSEKIPDLELIPDQSISVLLEENTEKIQRLFLHLFHFRSFYRERHYHEKTRLAASKLLFKTHIVVLRFDNRIIRLMKRMRPVEAETTQEEVAGREYAAPVQKEEVMVSAPVMALKATTVAMPQATRMQEVRPRRRVSPARVSPDPSAPLRPRRTQRSSIRLVSDEQKFPSTQV